MRIDSTLTTQKNKGDPRKRPAAGIHDRFRNAIDENRRKHTVAGKMAMSQKLSAWRLSEEVFSLANNEG
jgi:hypothetical protein